MKKNRFWWNDATQKHYITQDDQNADGIVFELSFVEYIQRTMPDVMIHDVETYPNVFTCAILDVAKSQVWRFEISHRVNHGVALFQFLIENSRKFVGFNSLGFDCPVLTLLVRNGGHVTAFDMFTKAQAIIDTDFNDRFKHNVYESEWYADQIDLFKIHHFDNVSRSTSLKMLEFNMRSQSIQDLPFVPATNLTDVEIDTLIVYNDHDIFETGKFFEYTLPMIEFRRNLSIKYNRNFMNHNDTKIGKDFFVMELERMGVQCFDGKKPRQSVRPHIALGEVILPMVNFNHPEFVRIHRHLEAQIITETKGVFKDLDCTIDGFKYVFGVGGIHGSIASTIVRSDATHQIIDIDVKSYYPNLAIVNRLHPEHLGEAFCDIYLDVYNQRKAHKKGTPENAMLKLALNGVYGDSGNQYSPFFDKKYMMSITINGQLLMCMLAEWLATIGDLSMIQINTDGLTVRCPHGQTDTLMMICKMWEQLTGLELERVDYSRMFIRDVNNYIAEGIDGKVKRKGAYGHGDDLAWHQNHSSQIVAIAAEQALLHDKPIATTVYSHTDPFDFMLRTKVPRSSRLMLECVDPFAAEGEPLIQYQQQNITRYYITQPDKGGSLMKLMPPLPKQIKLNADAPERRIGISVGWRVSPCNNMNDYDPNTLNRDYYIKEAEKLVNPLIG